MTIKIKKGTVIADVQCRFRSAFPFLKIEFSDKAHQTGEATVGGHWYRSETKVRSIIKKLLPIEIVIRPWDKTGDVERKFEQTLGLHAQIFRKDEQRWIQTAGTDIFTLDEQNEIGRRLEEKTSGISHLERENLL
ncbi:MAG: hypothetical protein EOO10_21355 [Chitinophagaceae bacterium]|nr:MAG: hypothetical protein EOO10_21355 [Chitinophagaceae bacterium]